ncbi:MAG: hypothetical protein ABFS12_04755 [Bacteroidota bacterium]
MKKINHQYGSDLKSKFDSIEKIHFVEDCQCYLGIRENKFSIVCDYRDFNETFKIKQKMLIEYKFDSKEECLKFIQDMIFIAPYNKEDIKLPKALE